LKSQLKIFTIDIKDSFYRVLSDGLSNLSKSLQTLSEAMVLIFHSFRNLQKIKQ